MKTICYENGIHATDKGKYTLFQILDSIQEGSIDGVALPYQNTERKCVYLLGLQWVLAMVSPGSLDSGRQCVIMSHIFE